MSDRAFRNLFTLFPVAVAIALAGYFLYSDYHSNQSREEAKANGEIIGEILYTENNVKRQFDSDVMWDGIQKKTPIYNKDSIRTGKESTAGIKLSDSTIIELGENSLIVLDQTAQSLNLKFKAGDLSTKNSSKNLRINVNDSIIKGEGATISVKTGADSKTSIKVGKGKATLTDKNKKTTEINESELAHVSDQGVEDVNKISVFLKSPENKSITTLSNGDLRQPFIWEVTSPSIKTEQLEISKSPSFKPELTQVYKAHQALSPRLGVGVYFWRVGWLPIKDIKKETKLFYTEVRQVTVGTDTNLELMFPENESHFDFHNDENSVNLQWKSKILPKTFVVEISKTLDFKKIVFTKTLAGLETEAKDLASGFYFWRVKAYGLKNEELAVSPPWSFSLRLKVAKLPELLKPLADAVWDSTEQTVFQWKKLEKASEYHFILSKDREQKEILKTKNLAVTSYSTFLNDAGTNYWSVRAFSSPSQLIGQSEVRKISFDLKQKTQNFILVNPKEKAILSREMSEAGVIEPVLFQWQITRPLPGPTNLWVSQKENFKATLPEDESDKLSASVSLIKSGVYYWKLTSTSPPIQAKKIEEVSEIGSFVLKVRNNFELPVLVEPADTSTLEADGLTSVKFVWNPVPQAVQYHIRVERLDPQKKEKIQVIDRVVKDWKLSSSPMSEGNYFWTVSSLNAEGEESGLSKQFSFILVSPIQLDAPKLNAPVIK